MIALADVLLARNISLGLLYFFPIVISAGYLSAGEIITSALLTLAEVIQSVCLHQSSVPRLITTFVAYFGTGALIRKIWSASENCIDSGPPCGQEIQRLEATEQQLRGLVGLNSGDL